MSQTNTQGEGSAREAVKLEYPLNNRDDYHGRIVFNVMKDQESDLGKALGDIEKMAQGGDTETKKALQAVTGSTNPTDHTTSMQSFDASDPKLETQVIPRPLSKMDREVSLYLPVGLQFRDAVQYDNTDIGGLGAGVEAGLQGGKGLLGSIMSGGLSTLTAGLKGAANKEVAQLSASRIISSLPDEISGAFKSASGITTNPNTRVLFKQVSLRDFSFVFKFIPTSAKEAEEVKQIVKLFRTELYPENIVLGLDAKTAISIGYRFPNKFQIDIEYRGEPIATKIKPCYLRDVGVTYNNTAMSMHSDGNFQETEMTLTFQESRTLNRRDVEKDGF